MGTRTSSISAASVSASIGTCRSAHLRTQNQICESAALCTSEDFALPVMMKEQWSTSRK